MNRVQSQWHERGLRQTLASFSRTHLLRTGLDLGLFEALREPRNANQLARDSRLAPDLLQAWLRAARAQGMLRLVSERDESYQVCGLARWLLDAPAADSLQALIEHAVVDQGPVFERMSNLLHGEERPAFGDSAEAQRAAEAARSVESRALEALARVPGTRQAKRVLDVGCGHGAYLIGLLLRYRDAQGVGIERNPEVAANAIRRLREADLERRCEVRVGDFDSVEFGEGAYDLILLNNNLYYFPPHQVEPLFERIRSLLAPRGVLAIQIPFVSEHPAARLTGHAATAAAFDLFLRAHQNLYGLPDLEELHDLLGQLSFDSIGECAFLPGGAARYIWARTAERRD
jgi:trans-aconitate methyltransferase